jgi:hypothetical protein
MHINIFITIPCGLICFCNFQTPLSSQRQRKMLSIHIHIKLKTSQPTCHPQFAKQVLKKKTFIVISITKNSFILVLCLYKKNNNFQFLVCRCFFNVFLLLLFFFSLLLLKQSCTAVALFCFHYILP